MIKIGGNEIDKPGFRDELARVLVGHVEPVVLVHGGGKAVDELLAQLGLNPLKVQGMRCTDSDTLRVTLMVLCGWVNKQLVASLIARGVDAMGMSGVDGGLIRVRKLEHPGVDLGMVGEIVSVRCRFLQVLIDQGIVPVVSPISLGIDGRIYNVNADQVASAVALAMNADALEFVSNVPGVLQNGVVTPHLDSTEAAHLIAAGEINGGMVPKVNAALHALQQGVPQVRITDLTGLEQSGGTTLTANPERI
ncbi:MAG: acetylglutamate kinase [Anaerolineales bacterium]|nr:acetylglutamate kinase [Anaerolineales bacterium]